MLSFDSFHSCTDVTQTQTWVLKGWKEFAVRERDDFISDGQIMHLPLLCARLPLPEEPGTLRD